MNCEKYINLNEFINKSNNDDIDLDSLRNIIRICYKKLKSHIYNDSTNLFMRKYISEYEAGEIKSLENKLDRLASKLIKGNDLEYNVKFRCLPKKVKSDKKISKNNIRNFVSNDKYYLNQVTYYIDIDIEVHIIGVLWTILFGKKLENKYGKYTYGNKLDDKFEFNNIKLFKPYYKQYQMWRDKGIKKVEDMMDENKRCLMITLDIKDYYYSANVDFTKLKKDLFSDKYKEINNNENISTMIDLKLRVNYLIEEIFINYSKNIFNTDNNIEEPRNIIPIGFIPSNIIANWYLKDFDHDIVDNLNLIYYGRYIDDIIMVVPTPMHIKPEECNDYKKVLHEKFCKRNILTYALQKNNENGDIIKLDNVNNFNNIENLFKSIPREEISLKKNIKEILKRYMSLHFHDAMKEIDEDFNIETDGIQSILNKSDMDTLINEVNHLLDDELIYEDWSSIHNSKIQRLLDKLDKIYREKRYEDITNRLTTEILLSIEFDSNQIKKIYVVPRFYKNNYRVNNKYKTNLCIQEAKVKVYDFRSDGSKALINNFKKEILHNASAFNFLPEKSHIIESFDEEIYKIDYSGSINKISSIEEFKIDKYGISKFLARVIYSDRLENNKDTEDVEEKILCLFKDDTCIELFTLWEKVMIYYLINQNHVHLMKFINEIVKSINKLGIELDTFQNYYYYINKENLQKELLKKTKENLVEHLSICISMVYALNDELFSHKIESSKDDKLKMDKAVHSIVKKSLNKVFDNIKSDEKKSELNDIIDSKFECIYSTKEDIRKSNMIRHILVRETLMNYTRCVIKNITKKDINLIEDRYINTEIRSNLKCTKLNKNYQHRYNCYNSPVKYHSECVFKIAMENAVYTPRFVHLHELILFNINLKMSKGEIISGTDYIEESINQFKEINNLKLEDSSLNYICNNIDKIKLQGEKIREYNIEQILCDYMGRGSDDKLIKKLLYEIKEYRGGTRLAENKFNRYKYSFNDYLLTQKESNINIIDIKNNHEVGKIKIGIVHMKVDEKDIDLSFSKIPNLESRRVQKINRLLNDAVKNGANIIVFPEVSIPYQWLDSISKFSMRHNVAIICGLEHIIYENELCCNYLATILPEKYNEYMYTIVKLRLKNHYSPREKEYVKGFNWKLPIMMNKEEYEKNKINIVKNNCVDCNKNNTDNESNEILRCDVCEWRYKQESECSTCKDTNQEIFCKEYDLIRWNNVDFSSYSCFELANIKDRALFTSHVDLLIGSVHNKDINYYSNIIESLSRDVHCYFVQVNNSELGDNRIISPSKSVKRNVLQMTGGENDLVLIGEIDIRSLREFQKKDHNLQMGDEKYKPVPPGFDYKNIKIRDELPL